MITRNAIVVSFSIVLLLVSVALVLLSNDAVAPDNGVSIEQNTNYAASSDSQTFAAIYDAEINGMNVRYYILPERNLGVVQRDYPDDMIFETGYSYDLIPDVNICRIKTTEEYLASADVSSGILDSLARCYGEMTLRFSPGEPLNTSNRASVARWVGSYKSACGNSLEPLGLPIIDRDCENVPTFEGAFLNI